MFHTNCIWILRIKSQLQIWCNKYIIDSGDLFIKSYQNYQFSQVLQYNSQLQMPIWKGSKNGFIWESVYTCVERAGKSSSSVKERKRGKDWSGEETFV